MPDTIALTRLLTRKSDVGSTRIDTVEVPRTLAEGEVVLSIDAFALTANNLTYASFGDTMRYWGFFPSGLPDWGLMPVWGFATVRESTTPGVEVGERFYGYFPMANLLRVRPGRLSERGFYDISEHRRELPSPYNQYTRCATDPAHVPELEDFQMLLRPLYFTSYMLADFLEDNAFFGADQLIISSASSKTAYGTAFSLKAQERPPRLIGLTSWTHREFVAGLGLYDEVSTYEELTKIPRGTPSLYVDFSGRDSLRKSLHAQLTDSLVYDCYAGSAANGEYLDEPERYTPTPQPFFAPTQIRKRNRDWGADVLASRFDDAQRRFLAAVSAPENAWMRVEVGAGLEDAAQIIQTLHSNGGHPRSGYTVTLSPPART